MYADISQEEREQQLIDNDISLSYTERRIWDMWRRWRMSEKKLYPWQYMTDKVYADDVIDLETMESIATKFEKEAERYNQSMEQSKQNRPNPNVRSLI